MRSAPPAMASRMRLGSFIRNFCPRVDELADPPARARAGLAWSPAKVEADRKRVNSARQRPQNRKELNELNRLNELNKAAISEIVERQAHEALPSPCAGN